MGESRINPETGVHEEDSSLFGGALGHKWEPVKNEGGNQTRVNPSTGTHEEDQSIFHGALGHTWEPVKNENGNQTRVNPSTGAHEEDQSVFNGALGHTWEPIRNESGNQTRVNPYTGLHEEDQSVFHGALGHTWKVSPDEEHRAERINPFTGIHEVDDSFFGGTFGYSWRPKLYTTSGSSQSTHNTTFSSVSFDGYYGTNERFRHPPVRETKSHLIMWAVGIVFAGVIVVFLGALLVAASLWLVSDNKPTATKQRVQDGAVVTLMGSILRSTPDRRGASVTKMRSGEFLHLLYSAKPVDGWYQVHHARSGKNGWVHESEMSIQYKYR